MHKTRKMTEQEKRIAMNNEFVCGPLQDCIAAAIGVDTQLEYEEGWVTEEWREILDECGTTLHKVPVSYPQVIHVTNGNGYVKHVNVHMDSHWGMLKDVIRALD